MTISLPTSAAGKPFRSRLINRYTLLAFIAGAVLAAGVGASALSAGMNHHGMMVDDANSADMSAHVDHVLKHLYAVVQATDAQKVQIDPLVRQAADDLGPLHSQLRAAHARVVQALEQTPVDRAALESARLQHLQLADQASTRLVQLIADVGDLLTAQQRKALSEHLSHMHGTGHS